MPELPDITIYIEALEPRVVGSKLTKFRIQNPFVLRTVEPTTEAMIGAKVLSLRRIGKRIAIGLEADRWIVFHLMIAGRFKWLDVGRSPPKSALAYLEFESGILVLTEAGSKRRASIHLTESTDVVRGFDPGGVDIDELELGAFKNILTKNNHTLKRALTDPKFFSGIGNAYSDEILHRAKLSPIQQTQKLSEQQIKTLLTASKEVLAFWTQQLRVECGEKFPTKVTAFREDMAVHGRFGQPCPVCETPVQRIRYATNEVNYCPLCQTGGKVLADRSLSRLLKKDWPRNVEELENIRPKK